jgi:putative transcriptional regulator
MNRFLTFLAIACCAIAPGAGADEEPGIGKFLVATDEVRGPIFFRTVILLLHHDENGAVGLVVNRRGGASPAEAVPDLKGLARYHGELFYGGPVHLHTMRTLLRTDSPPVDAIHVVDNVYVVDLDEALLEKATTDSVIRFYAGYAGWSPGQLEYEIRTGSWYVINATEDVIFSDEPEAIWETLQPPQTYRAYLQRH